MRPAAPIGAMRVDDPTGLASAALGYTLDLSAGQSVEPPVALPFDGAGAPPTAANLDNAHAAAVARWQATLGRATINVPPEHRAVADSVRTALVTNLRRVAMAACAAPVMLALLLEQPGVPFTTARRWPRRARTASRPVPRAPIVGGLALPQPLLATRTTGPAVDIRSSAG